MKQGTIDRIRKFTEDRDWDQFHSPENLAKSIVIEAAELLECFQWSDKDYDLQHVKEELADVIVYSQNLLDKLGLDADEIVNMKMDQNEAKYPVEKAKGSAAKYDKLQMSIMGAFLLFVVAGMFEMQVWARVLLMGIGFAITVMGIAIACVLDREAGAFECPECKERFVPDMKSYVMGPHTITKRKLTCPKCGCTKYCKHVLTR